jgi:hypothetical protein
MDKRLKGERVDLRCTDHTMLAIIAQISLVSTMFWLYAAAALLVVLFVLLTAPYFGVFGERGHRAGV